MTSLFRFFAEECLYREALNSYGRFASGANWPIRHKLDLYNHAKAAFVLDIPVGQKLEHFSNIYSSLKNYWKVFRGCPSYWSEAKVFQMLVAECQPFAQTSSVSLQTLKLPSRECTVILESLRKFRNLKQTKYYPWMPVSKFIHFYNPALFPIYDYAVMWQQVLNGVFQGDWYGWCLKRGIEPLEIDAESESSAKFNVHYSVFAAEAIQQSDSRFMDVFAEWFKSQVGSHPDPYGVLNDIHRYFATAFEFVAIGAAQL